LDLVSKGDTAGGLKYLQQASQASPEMRRSVIISPSRSPRATERGRPRHPQKLVNSDASPDVKQSAKTLLAQMKDNAGARMTVLVTGGAGYIGSHMTYALATRASACRALQSLDRRARQCGARCGFVQGDVGDARAP